MTTTDHHQKQQSTFRLKESGKDSARTSVKLDPKKLGVQSPIVAQVLYNRGVDTADSAQQYLRPEYERDTHNPFLLKGMKEAVERLHKAICNNEHIMVYADFDADGVPGVTIFHDFLARIGYAHARFYVPHRHNEGFGFHEHAVDECIRDNVTLIITIDCGIADVAATTKAVAAGIDVIITDHHVPGPQVPPASVIVNPAQEGCTYPHPALCGSAVIFKVVHAYLMQYGAEAGVPAGWERWLLDLVAMATIADMMPLTGENRALTYFGLQVMRKTARPAWKVASATMRVPQGSFSEDDVSFSFAPRINAASRFGSPYDAFNFLRARSAQSAADAWKVLEDLNVTRRGIVAALVKETHRRIAARHIEAPSNSLGVSSGPRVIVLGDPHWRPSVLGLVASRLVEEYGCPVFLWGRDGKGELKGSCRSVPGVHIAHVMHACADIFIGCGGHAGSGGFAITLENVAFLETRLQQALITVLDGKDMAAHSAAHEVDAIIPVEAITPALIDELSLYKPYGLAFPKPLFAVRPVCIVSVRAFGKQRNHLEIVGRGEQGASYTFTAFFADEASWREQCVVGAVCTIIAQLERSYYGASSMEGVSYRGRVEDVIFEA
jgi:single-stranded-DNA-specific exonuclease